VLPVLSLWMLVISGRVVVVVTKKEQSLELRLPVWCLVHVDHKTFIFDVKVDYS
jgi:hypothetical protein